MRREEGLAPVGDCLWEGELDLGGVEPLHVIPPTLGRFDRFNSDDVDVVHPRTVPGRHVPVAGGYRSNASEVSVLSVHVVRTRPGVVAEPNAEILHLVRGFLSEFYAL